jgi:hypothetical protein
VTVGQSEKKALDLSFSSSQLAQGNTEGGILTMLPALELPMLGEHH